MFLGYRLKKLRKQKQISQTELGNLLGVTKVSVSGYENGTRIPSMDILIKILDVFQVSADYLLGREVSCVCEDDESVPLILSSSDVEIIREIRGKPTLYNQISKDPKRFFLNAYKKKI